MSDARRVSGKGGVTRRRRSRPAAFVRCGGGSPACEGGAVCADGCTACGACVESCRFGAIRVSEGTGVAVVDREKCTACGLCARACPQHVIELVPPERAIRVRCANTSTARESRQKCSVGCIACGICVKACPSDAMRLEQNHARVDYDVCIACGMCATKCPRKAISDAFGIVAGN